MKALKNSLLASLVLLAGCIKDTIPAVSDDEQTYPLTFKVSSFDVGDEPMTRNSPPITTRAEGSPPLYEKFQTLEYHGYISSAQKFKGKQTYDPAKPEEFGSVKAQVPSGSYYLGFFGIGPGIGSYRINLGEMMGDNDYLENTGLEIWHKELKGFPVSAETENVEIEMTRLTGRLVLDITDQVPESVKRVTVNFYYHSRYRLTYGVGKTYFYAVPHLSDLTIIDNKVRLFEFNSFPINVTNFIISIYGDNDTLLDERTISVSTYENRKTIIRGELFNNIDSKDFIITVSDDWGEDNVINL